MNRLVLIDGNAILHRAYHAIPPFTFSDGSPAGAVYGFISMLIKIYNDLKPTHIAVAFDRAAPTFRQELFKEYQAQRPKMEDNLVGQVDKVHDVVTSFGIPIYEVDGFEADDVIGTITKQSKNQVIIVTGDRDILQLVDDEKVFVFMPTKGLSEGKLYGEKEVVERMGVKPSQVPNFKALAGDPSDNYPGVSGIGPKTAVRLLEKHKTFQKVLATLTKKDQESALLSQKLATIRTDAPVKIDLDKARLTTLDTPSARKALEDFHFPSLLKRLKLFEKKPTNSQLSLV
ncbi:MAG: hypothetical protein ACD_28C00431G0002 [uncultured bacterium]|uniref:5'-3' exonuclease domain-containing protein n=1 Tax=Candidatus Gottesmanbacteria bacterium RIFCSPLOWO2_01_FULL_43_11b TaxID=1798392 RepID=A0A1F6AI08_9BACT|nr:MAG: hypothetical protein ACD_28C00431G0002 [uncultured bacterium]OGG24023.1 MAG: hypothetical protein A3A79_02390 [Candidatus Gottesmanbacteria bacterium RIFCSPLOWO2_01_FULL_43_11b]